MAFGQDSLEGRPTTRTTTSQPGLNRGFTVIPMS
jgi:hypothetical protein